MHYSFVMLNMKRVVAAVSGGIDSAVAALFLKHKGYDVIGVFMENWDIVDETGSCSAAQNEEDAQWVCKFLGIPFQRVNFVKDYWNYVFCDLLKDYERGYTPNPDILCNRRIKFDSFYNYAKEKMEACAIATGHYARTSFGDYLENYDAGEGVHLLKPVDLFKDQTFFLSQVPQFTLQKTMFPLGKLTKKQVKRIACESGMEYLVHKKESTGICFIGTRNFQKFISEYVVEKPGWFRDIDSGQTVGEHAGIHQWTIGQRCRIGGQVKPYFVARKDLKFNDIYVASGTEHPSLFTHFFLTSKPHWIHSIPQSLLYGEMFECEFRFQHTKPLVKCELLSIIGDQLLVLLDVPLRAITLGQYAVFYKSEECMGSARIVELGPSLQNLGFEAQEDILTRNAVCWQPPEAPLTKPPKALTKPGKAFCVPEFARSESVVSTGAFHAKYHKDPPVYNSIMKWYRKFEEDGCLCDGKRSGQPGVSEEKVEQVKEAFQHSPSKSMRRASRELKISHTTDSIIG